MASPSINSSNFDNFIKIGNSIKEKISDPKNTLLNSNRPKDPIILYKKDIVSQESMSKYVFILYTPMPFYVSTVFNRNFSFTENNFKYIIAKRCLDSIYYDLEIHY